METIDSTTQALACAVRTIIHHFDADPTRDGLEKTPERYIKFLTEFTNAAEFELTEFDGDGYDQMVIQKDIPFYSFCEHHLAPFFGVAHVAYIPNGKIVGLSKLSRTVDKFASGFQNQERITKQIAEYLHERLNPLGVAVVLEAEHLCMAMRGVKKLGVKTQTSEVLGVFREKQATRMEFFQLLAR